MPTKIRLQRHGKKRYAFYHVVVADARAPRDGKFIEKLGTYNPNVNPATIDINFDRSLYWVKQGAQPTDTCRALLSYRGILHKDHLDRGVLKGALTQEEADKKFDAWLKEKESKIDSKRDALKKAILDSDKTRLAAEKEANEKRAAEILAKTSELAKAAAEEAEAATEEAAESVAEDTSADEAKEETKAKDSAAEEVKAEETAAEEVKEEEPKEAKVEEPVTEGVKEETAEEVKAEDATTNDVKEEVADKETVVEAETKEETSDTEEKEKAE